MNTASADVVAVVLRDVKCVNKHMLSVFSVYFGTCVYAACSGVGGSAQMENRERVLSVRRETGSRGGRGEHLHCPPRRGDVKVWETPGLITAGAGLIVIQFTEFCV